MAIKYLRIGSMKDAFGYDDAMYPEAGEFPGPLKIIGPPTNANHALRLGDLGGITVGAVDVVNIDDPSAELNIISGTTSSLLLVYQTDPGPNQVTLYAWDSAVSGGEDIPYIVNGSSGFWFAIGGKYIDSPTYRRVSAQNSTTTLTLLNRVYTVSSAIAVVLTLPAANKIGSWLRFHKRDSGDLTITAAGTDVIVDSSAGGSVSNTTPTDANVAFIELECVAVGKWALVGIYGTWS